MESLLQQAVREFFARQRQDRQHGGRLIVAVSGGLDSVVLLDCLAQVLDPKSLVVAHVDHRTRRNSGRDARFVKAIAKKRGIAFRATRLPVWEKSASEDTLRRERRRFLLGLSEELGGAFIATAHHADDQIETLFLRLMRGTSAKGLSGMRPRNGQWLKPFLGVSKSELETYAKARRLRWVEDESNRSSQYLRNRLRHELLPRFFSIAQPFGDSTTIAKRTVRLLNEVAALTKNEERRSRRRLDRIAVRTPYWIRIPSSKLLSLKPNARRSLIRVIALDLGVTALTRFTLDRVERHILEQKRAFDVSQGVRAVISCGQCFFTNPQLESNLVTEQAARLIEWREPIPAGASLRFPLPGDRLGRTKLKKILNERRIPLPERKILPVLATKKGEILWILSNSKSEPETRHTRSRFPFSFLSESSR